MSNYKNRIIAFFTFIGGLYFFLEFVLPKNIFGYKFGAYHQEISTGVQLIGLMAIGLGIINIFRVHGANIIKQKKGWFNSVGLLFGLLVVFFFQFNDFGQAERRTAVNQEIENLVTYVELFVHDKEIRNIPAEPRIAALVTKLHFWKNLANNKDALFDATGDETSGLQQTFLESLDNSLSNTEELRIALSANENIDERKDNLIRALRLTAAASRDLTEANYENMSYRRYSNFVFNAFMVPLGSAMFSLLAFYIVTAAYRSLRIRSLEALIMMIPALIVMLGQIPHGPLYVSESLPEIRRWLLEYLNTAAFRAIYFGSAIAGLAMAIRMWLSLEKSPLSSDTDNEEGK